jgi:hypothetical protein
MNARLPTTSPRSFALGVACCALGACGAETPTGHPARGVGVVGDSGTAGGGGALTSASAAGAGLGGAGSALAGAAGAGAGTSDVGGGGATGGGGAGGNGGVGGGSSGAAQLAREWAVRAAPGRPVMARPSATASSGRCSARLDPRQQHVVHRDRAGHDPGSHWHELSAHQVRHDDAAELHHSQAPNYGQRLRLDAQYRSDERGLFLTDSARPRGMMRRHVLVRIDRSWRDQVHLRSRDGP